jgi:cutinase
MRSSLLVAALSAAGAYGAVMKTGYWAIDTTEFNDLVTHLDCKPITVLFARGTWEPQGSSGGTLVGGKFIKGIEQNFPGQVAAQGIDYKASIMGYIEGGSDEVTKKLSALAKTAVSSCPTTKLVIGGYR